MKIIINRLAALGMKTGIGHYTAELYRHLRQIAGEAVVEVFPRGWMRQVRETCIRLRPYLESQASPCAPAGTAGAQPSMRQAVVHSLREWGRKFTAAYFRRVCRAGQYDLYHEPNFIPFPGDVPAITTICDLSALLHPEWHPADRVAFFEKHFLRSLERSRHFIAISEYGRQEIIRTLGIAPHRISRTYMGIRPNIGPLPTEKVQAELVRMGLPQRYLLYLGTIEPRKNVLMLLRAYCALPEYLRCRWPLLMVGGWGWKSGDVAEFLHQEARHRGVIHVGYAAEDQMAVLYNGARALLYPTIYEGFGLPPLEMMATGGAVLASTAGALQETIGGKAYLIDPHDRDGWRDALARVLTDDDWWHELRRQAIETARPFTWRQCAIDTLRAYRRVLAGDTMREPGVAA